MTTGDWRLLNGTLSLVTCSWRLVDGVCVCWSVVGCGLTPTGRRIVMFIVVSYHCSICWCVCICLIRLYSVDAAMNYHLFVLIVCEIVVITSVIGFFCGHMSNISSCFVVYCMLLHCSCVVALSSIACYVFLLLLILKSTVVP